MIRQAVRRLFRARTFALASILTLTLGIGGATAVFTMVNGVLLRPLPYDRADRLVDLSHSLVISGVAHVDESDATYLLYRRDNHVFTDIGAYRSMAVNLGLASASGATAATAERVSATRATASLFHVLAVRPLLGRELNEEDDRPGAAPVVVLSQRIWERSFGGDRNIVGRRVMIDGVERQVAGVMPGQFDFPDAGCELWLPLQLDAANTKSAAFDYRAVARLRDGVSLAAATSELQQLLPRVPEAFPGRLTLQGIQQIHMQPVVRSLRDAVVGDVSRVLWIVLGAVAMLLLIACANVANLFLARSEGRQRELAVRSALGASAGALLSELLSEALILAVVGGVLGLCCAAVGVSLLKSVAIASSIPRLAEARIDGVVVVVAMGLVVVAALVVSALPLLRLRSSSLNASLLGSTRSATSGRASHRARHAFVVLQVALALMLVCGAGLFVRSFARLRAVNPGFAPQNAVAFRIALPEASYPGAADAGRMVIRALDAIGAVPGVQAQGAITKLPLDAESQQDSAVWIEDHPLAMGGIPDLHEIDFVTPGYFRAMGIPLVAGQLFAAPDPRGLPSQEPPTVIVSAAFAAHYWPGGSAIGKRVRMFPLDPWHTIVGVVGDVRGAGLDQPPTEEVYCPLVTLSAAGMPWTPRNLAIVVRTSGDATALTSAARRAVASLDPMLPLYRVMPLSGLVAAATARTTFTLTLLVVAAIVATVIGALGIYGVISYLVTLRTREIGLRLALGAEAGAVRLLIARQAVTDAAIGVVIGVAGALSLGRVLGAATFDASPNDPVILCGAAVLLLVTAFAASWVPARRAAALDPTIALRAE